MIPDPMRLQFDKSEIHIFNARKIFRQKAEFKYGHAVPLLSIEGDGSLLLTRVLRIQKSRAHLNSRSNSEEELTKRFRLRAHSSTFVSGIIRSNLQVGNLLHCK